MNPKRNLEKIAFDVSNSNDSGFEVERLWAKHIRGNIYRIDNSPYQIYGVSLGDEVFAKKVSGELQYSGMASRGGHSTYRVRLPVGLDHEYFLRYWDDLAKLGCTFEGASGEQRLYAIDIPDAGRVADVYRILQKREGEGVWEFEEAHYYDPARE